MPGPRRIVLVRHARSLANDDPHVYATMEDFAIPLASPNDDASAFASADAIAALDLRADDTATWTSTHLRCKQTEALIVARAFPQPEPPLLRYESSLVRERDYGDWNGLQEEQIRARDAEGHERWKCASNPLGKFYFRYPNGESRADVVGRVAVFIERLLRHPRENHLVFCHGVSHRAFRMAFFDRTVAWLEAEPTPGNVTTYLLSLGDDGAWSERLLFAGSLR